MAIEISARTKRRVPVLGHAMAVFEAGSGPAVVFLHGNPTSSYLWRNVLPAVLPDHRAIAPDLIGMGDSDKLPRSGPDRYRFVEHARFLDALLDSVLNGNERVVLVVHDWGSALGFHWARRHQHRVRGIAFMEAIVAPVRWDDWPLPMRPTFEALRSPEGERLVLEDNLFVESILPASVMRKLATNEMDEYRRPFARPGEDRRPTLTWPREIPIEGEPADVDAIVSGYGAWLAGSDLPKLFVNAKPGAILRGRMRDIVRTWPNLTEIEVPGIHFVQEDSGEAIGSALREWMTTLP